MAAFDDESKPFFRAESLHQPLKPQSTPESKFWRSFKTSPLLPSSSSSSSTGGGNNNNLILPITSIEFSPLPPHDLAFSVSASIHLHSGSTTLSPKPFSPLSSFSDLAFSPSFRCDGALLAAGGHSGLVQIFKLDKAGHAIRKLKSHSAPVRLVRYPKILDKLHLLSAGDDALLNYWDVPSQTPLLSLPAAHRDYIRAGSASPVSSEVFATGSYDHSVKIWDVRVVNPGSSNGGAVASFDHGDPVESVLFLPSGGLIATAGGNCVKIWDVIGGGRCIHTMASHNKTVTALCLGRVEGGGGERILSVSIDGYLKSFDYGEFKVTHSMRYPSQLLSVGFSPSGMVRVVGTSNGGVYAGKRKVKNVEVEIVGKVGSVFDGLGVPEPEEKVLRPTNFRYFRRGQSEKAVKGDYIVERAKKVKMADHDKLLKKFAHKGALVSALNGKRPNSVVAVMEELVARKKLIKCVENLEVEELGLLLGFLHRWATMPRYARFLMGLAKRVLELRADDVKSSEELRHHGRNLKRMITEEIKIQHSLQEIQGMILPLLAIAGR